MSNKVTYTFSWPPAELSPNARVHWAKLAKVKREYKEACGWEIRLHLGHSLLRPSFKPPIVAQVTFVCDGRRRDPDNHMAMLKPMWDALVEMGVLEDDSHDKLKILDPEWERGEKRVIVELRRDWCRRCIAGSRQDLRPVAERSNLLSGTSGRC